MFTKIVTYCKHFVEGDLRAYRNVQWMVLLLVDPISRIDRRPLLSAAQQKRHNAEDCFVFTVRQVEEDVILSLEENFSGGVVLDGPVDPAVLEQLELIAGKYDLVSWDGFNESSSGVLDGSAFSLSMTLADGRTVEAQGNNAFPGGYNEAESEILQIYRSLLPVEYLTEVE